MRIAIIALLTATLAPASALACPGSKSDDGQVAAKATPAANDSGAAGDVGKKDCAGCPDCPKAKAAKGAKLAAAKAGEITDITVGQLVDLRGAGAAVAILDANSEKTRGKFGMIPGAVALTSYKGYDVAKELPADKATALVFYCSNKRCGASHAAAERAKAAGYTNVMVLKAGIMGWAEAGQKTTLSQS